jgi:hypothetical protein
MDNPVNLEWEVAMASQVNLAWVVTANPGWVEAMGSQVNLAWVAAMASLERSRVREDMVRNKTIEAGACLIRSSADHK